jgi:hypothetical protein
MELASTILIALFLSGFLMAAQATLPERVRRHGQTIEEIHIVEYPPDRSLADMARISDLIARVVIVDGRSHLTKDQAAIETDHTVDVLDQLYSRRSIKPGETIVVTRSGGTAMIEGSRSPRLTPIWRPLQLVTNASSS